MEKKEIKTITIADNEEYLGQISVPVDIKMIRIQITILNIYWAIIRI